MPWNRIRVFVLAASLPVAVVAQEPATRPYADNLALAHGLATGQPKAPLPPVVPSGRPSVGLALEGGGALGLAHVGVLQWLEQHRIPIDRIAGTSMGALVSGLYAAGRTPAELRAIAVREEFSRVFTLQTPYSESSFRRRQDRREVPQGLLFGLRQGPHLRNALFSDRGVNAFLTTNIYDYNSSDLDFNRLPIPFRCVATDLNTLQPVTFAGGPLPQAIRASISIPGVFSPVPDRNGHLLVDGGILDNLPTDLLRHDLHADQVIAVRLVTSPVASADTSSVISVLNRAFSAGIERNADDSERLADVVIHVPVDKWSASDYNKAAELIEAGFQAAERSHDALIKYALSAEGWDAYLADRASRVAVQPGVLRHVKVEGGNPAVVRQVLADLKSIENQPISPVKALGAISLIQSNGGYAATWETFNPDGPGPNSGILVRLSRDPTGPPFMLIGPELAAATSNVSRAELNLRLVDQNLGGFGSELRANARFGYMLDVSAEYYRLLTPGGYFVEPGAGVVREPVYIWANQKRIAERFEQDLDASLEVGRTFSNQFQVSAEWEAKDTRWSLRTGNDGGGYLSGTAQTGQLHIRLDHAASGAVSPSGYRFSLSAGALLHAEASSNAPIVRAAFSRTISWRDNIFAMSGEVNSYLRANVAQPYRFTLGGPLRLSASSFDEYRGTDNYLARTGIMHRIAALPTGLGEGLYASFGYEAGEIWSPEARSFLRQDGMIGLVGNTPIGLFTVGVSAGDAGHRKVFVTLGRWF
jgi:NTE family protein